MLESEPKKKRVPSGPMPSPSPHLSPCDGFFSHLIRQEQKLDSGHVLVALSTILSSLSCSWWLPTLISPMLYPNDPPIHQLDMLGTLSCPKHSACSFPYIMLDTNPHQEHSSSSPLPLVGGKNWKLSWGVWRKKRNQHHQGKLLYES